MTNPKEKSTLQHLEHTYEPKAEQTKKHPW